MVFVYLVNSKKTFVKRHFLLCTHLFIYSSDKDEKEKKADKEERRKKKHEKKKDEKQSNIPTMAAKIDVGQAKKLKPEDQIHLAMIADYQRKRRLSQKPKTRSSSSSSSTDDEKVQKGDLGKS